MNLKRIFSNAVARRVAYLLVAAAFAWLGIGTARAGNYGCDAGDGCDQGQAYAACMVEAAGIFPGDPGVGNRWCRLQGASNNVYQACAGTAANPTSCSYSGGASYTYHFTPALSCATRPEEVSWAPAAGLGNVCSEGCAYAYAIGIGVPSSYTPTGAVCTNADFPEPAVDTDGDGVPDDLDAFPNDPNESVDSDGDGIGDNADIAPNDPENGEDEGEGDETDNSAQGGGDCSAPPSCKGDGIQCNTNFQVWKLRCQGTAHGSVTGNVQDCSSGIVVQSPDPIANAQLLALRKIACDGEGGGTGTDDGFGTGDSDNLGKIANAVEADGEGDLSIGPEEPGDAWFGEGDGELPDGFDESGYGFGNSCPEIPAIDVFGTSIEFNIEPLCDWATLGGYIVVALAGLACVRIISGRAA